MVVTLTKTINYSSVLFVVVFGALCSAHTVVDDLEFYNALSSFASDRKREDFAKIKMFLHEHPEYRSLEDEKTKQSLFAVISRALVGGPEEFQNDAKELIKDCLRQPGWDLLQEVYTWSEDKATDGRRLTPEEVAVLAVNRKSIDAFKKAVDEAWQSIVDKACDAIAKKDLTTLDQMITQWPTLLNPPDYPESKTTLLHYAVVKFNSSIPQSVTIFTHLMKKGANVNSKNSDGISVEELVTKNHAAYVSFKHMKKLRENPSGIDRKELKQKVEKNIDSAKPHWKLITGCILVAGLIIWLVARNNVQQKNTLSAALMTSPGNEK